MVNSGLQGFYPIILQLGRQFADKNQKENPATLDF